MIKRHFHIWISIVGAVLVSIFSDYTQYYISYLLRVPGYIFAQHLSVYVTIRLADETYYLSVIKVVMYSLIIYTVIYLISCWRKWRHQGVCYG